MKPESQVALPAPRRERGSALLIILALIGIGAAFLLVSALMSNPQIERDKITAAALAQAKEALIGYAASVDTSTGRPGDLPCPDTNNDGVSETNCGNAFGSTGQNRRLGRLPWKTLGLSDLRDGNGERLWYAVSNNFKNNTRTTCTSPGMAGCLNSDTNGTITIRDSTGTIVNNGTDSTAAIAVIISPGSALTRQDGVNQVRDAANANNPVNYLDIGSGEDNADFADGSSANGFIQGRIKDGSGNVILNDQLLTITQDNIMQAIQKRVAAEVKQCLNEYANDLQNKGRYPWVAKLDPANPVNYNDSSNKLFGRIPDTPFTNTCVDSGGYASGHGTNNCSASGNPIVGMKNTWTGNCNINSSSGWWLNWKEMVFYGLSDAYKPVNPLLTPAANVCATAGACLSVNPPSATADKKFVVIVAGKKLAGQARLNNADKGTLSNYLEAPNNGGATAFAQGAFSATFNDTVVFP